MFRIVVPVMKKKNEKSRKKIKKQDGDSYSKRVFKPRHGLRMQCNHCGWRFRGGGYETKKQVLAVEKEQALIHKHIHIKSKTLDKDSLTIDRDYHAAEITHAFTEQPARQFTASTTYIDVPGASVGGVNFTANQDHLVIVTAQGDTSTAAGDVDIRMVLGTAPTVITDSEASLDNATTNDPTQRMIYTWWTVLHPATAQALKMQFLARGTSNTVGVDLITISVIKLSPDLTLNTDYKSDLRTATTTTMAATNPSTSSGDTTANNATISMTPTSSNHKWLILSKARYTVGATTTGVNSRIERSGATTNSQPQMQKEGEDTVDEKTILCGMRTDTLTGSGATHTYTEISKANNTGVGTEGVSAVRTDSGIFMLDLSNFKTIATNHEDTPFEDYTTNTVSYGQTLHTQSITPVTAGDFCILGFATQDSGGSGTATSYWKMRMQIDDTDPQDLPTPTTNDVTTKSYGLCQWDTADRLPILLSTVENLSTSAHTIDIDGSLHDNTNTLAAGKGTYVRNITAFSMELSSAAITQIKSESVGITEGVIAVLGKKLTKVVSESVGVTEVKSQLLGTAGNFVTASNFQLRLSGGATNVDPQASLGGAMSTVNPSNTTTTHTADYSSADYFVDDYMTADETTTAGTASGIVGSVLFDNVSIAEALSGDPTPDHRCFYMYNSHSTLAMQDLKIWIGTNTQGDDYVEIGLGNSGVGTSTTETAIANEGVAPSPTVTFTIAASKATAITITSLPALNHKAIWIRRTVPPGTNNAVPNNKYTIMAEFVTNHT